MEVHCAHSHNCTHVFTLALVSASLLGCGGSDSGTIIQSQSTAGPSGKVIQGAVNGATIWADAVSAGVQFSIDSAEQGTQTKSGSSGAYTVPVTPTYKYVMVSQGGTDTLTNQTAGTLIAPGGAKTVSPLTTLVMLDTTGKLATALNSLLPAGLTFDSDFTAAGGLSPAAMVFLTSVTTAVTSFDAALAKGGATLSTQQINNVNMTLLSKMATQFASASTLTDTSVLSTNLQTAVSGALTTIAANNSNIGGLNASAIATLSQTIAVNSVVASAQVVGNATNNAALKAVTVTNVQTTGVTVASTGTVTESSIITGTNLQTVVNTITSVAASTAAVITVTATPSSYTPPSIPVANNPSITGYKLVATASGNAYAVSTFTISFSDDMVSSASGGTNFAHSVLNPANYTFTQQGCSPSSYSSNTVTFSCGSLQQGNFGVVVTAGTSTSGVWANSTSLGLLVNVSKVFALPATTGSTGGSSVSLF